MKKITIADIRKIKVGQTKTFRFENAVASKNFQQWALRDARLRGYAINTVCDIDKAKLTVTRTA